MAGRKSGWVLGGFGRSVWVMGEWSVAQWIMSVMSFQKFFFGFYEGMYDGPRLSESMLTYIVQDIPNLALTLRGRPSEKSLCTGRLDFDEFLENFRSKKFRCIF